MRKLSLRLMLGFIAPAAMQLANYVDRGQWRAAPWWGIALVAAYFAGFWALALRWVRRGSVVQAIGFGAISFFIGALPTLVAGTMGIYYVAFYWQVFVPAGALAGLIAWRFEWRGRVRP